MQGEIERGEMDGASVGRRRRGIDAEVAKDFQLYSVPFLDKKLEYAFILRSPAGDLINSRQMRWYNRAPKGSWGCPGKG